MKKILFGLSLAFAATQLSFADSFDTQRKYISGRGCDDMVQWDFMCTDGRNSGKWTKIGVPSCWELQGFGTFQYGMKFYGKAHPEGIAKETGKYKHEFTLPKEWEGKQILLCFEASMTDTYCEINGRKAGSKHKGGFTPFFYDVSDRVFFGKKKNTIVVTVDKESEEDAVNMAERRADYWNFGGIIRPVFFIAKPAQNIERVAIDARHDGHFMSTVYLNRAVENASVKIDIKDIATGKVVATASQSTRNSDNVRFDMTVQGVKPWSSETPNRYEAIYTLVDQNNSPMHREKEKFGFRTIEVRKHDGVYVNNQKVMFKGVNRHSFWPETGRTLSYAKNLEDVKIMREMNMNAVRLSHYPADPEFLDICDSLGLYVLDEHPGWHWYHSTINGTKLVEDMIKRDQNHPSIVFWDNGNEGGFNMELDPVFHEVDLQKRIVLYPWANEHGMETKHYRSWGETQALLREPEITMPTEFLHGLYDGGHGAGLWDYWVMMRKAPRCAGGFLWDLADEGVKRVDMDGIIDNVGNYGADGIIGPHHEKEGSFFTIKEIWCPIQITNLTSAFDNALLELDNQFDFINLKDCKFRYAYKTMPAPGTSKVTVQKQGTLAGPDVAPHAQGSLALPRFDNADILEVTVIDNRGDELYTWSMHPSRAKAYATFAQTDKAAASISVSETDRALTIASAGKQYVFNKKTGELEGVKTAKSTFEFNGPKFICAKRADRSQDGFYNHDDKQAEKKKTQFVTFPDQGKLSKIDVKDNTVTVTYDHAQLEKAVWAFNADGTVSLTYQYTFGGVIDQMGIMFDYPEQNVKSKNWVGDGPYRVWQNRLHGAQYGYWSTKYNDPVPGETFEYPEFKGYFANCSWMQLQTTDGNITLQPVGGFAPAAVANSNNRTGAVDYIGVYTPRDGRDHILYTLPETGISLLKVIPPVRNKVNCTDLNGPSAQPFWADQSQYGGTVIMNFE